MIAFRPMNLAERIKRLWPAYRHRRDEEMREAIKWLIQNPDAPCTIDGHLVKDGYGQLGADPLIAAILGKPRL